MSRVLFVDVIGGAAGDMLLASLLDAGAPEEAVHRAIEAVLPGRFEIGTEEVRRGGLRARALQIRPGGESDAGGNHDHQARSFRDLVATVEDAGLAEGVRDRALAILRRLGEAEARVHGLAQDDVTLHLLGDDDTLIDAVGFAAAIEALAIERIEVSSIPLAHGVSPEEGGGAEDGGGDDHGAASGAVPLPPPATLELLKGFAVRGGGVGETVTPTAAAVFAALAIPSPVGVLPEMMIEAIGYGAGTRDPAGYPNVLRVLVGDQVAPEDRERPDAELTLLEANLDDMTPELVADAAGALLANGALDAWIAPVLMKKGRPGVVVSALCESRNVPSLRRVFFEATTTFGVRASTVRRTELIRRMATVRLQEGTVRVKVGMLQGRVLTVKPEHDDVAQVAGRTGRSVREVHEEAVAAARELRYEGVDV
jgi:uncharacterized protein (TIGR00299 family) protein